MKAVFTGCACVLLSVQPLLAGGLERAPQSIGVLFEEGNYLEFGLGGASPTINNTDALGLETGNVAKSYAFGNFAYKHQFNSNWSGAVIVEQPFGVDISYPLNGSPLNAGTVAKVDSTTFTVLGRYKFDNNFSVHGGLRGSWADGFVRLAGVAYGGPPPFGVSGYEARMESAWGAGYVAGAAYEVPDYAARISVTYNSDVKHDFDTHELFAPGLTSTTTVRTPQSLSLDWQTGIAANTLLFGSVRWVDWSEFKVEPTAFRAITGSGLVDLKDTVTYSVGIGRKFNENWSGLVSFTYEAANDDVSSPLAPNNGLKSFTIAPIYTMGKMRLMTGLNYSIVGDGGNVWGGGVRVGYTF